MTDRFNSITVVLEHDIRDDDAEPILAAICQLRGVLTVKGNVADIASHVAAERARHAIANKLLAVLREN